MPRFSKKEGNPENKFWPDIIFWKGIRIFSNILSLEEVHLELALIYLI
jgi:hypothetical protein